MSQNVSQIVSRVVYWVVCWVVVFCLGLGGVSWRFFGTGRVRDLLALCSNSNDTALCIFHQPKTQNTIAKAYVFNEHLECFLIE